MKSRPWRRFGVATGAVAALVIALAGPVSPATASASCVSTTVSGVQKRILSEVNAARSKAGVRSLTATSALHEVAINWSRKQAASSTMSHNPNYASQIPSGWIAAGENVAYGYTYDKVTSAWMASTGHRANILRSSFTHIGIGVACSSSGRPYYTQVFGGYRILKGITPTISGTPKVGKTLTAIRGTWASDVSYSYRWYADGTFITGATAKTYKPKASDVGKAIKVKVTGKKSGYASTTRTSAASADVAKGTLPTITPRISGTPKVGEVLTAIRGTWTSNVSYSYRWYADGSFITGATGKTYRAKASDVGKVLKVKVTGKKSGYVSATRTSAASDDVAKGTLSTITPRISGTAKVGETVTAIRGTWTSGTSYSYRWYANGSAISGATGKSMVVKSAQRGTKLTVKVTGKKAGYTTRTRVSAATSTVR